MTNQKKETNELKKEINSQAKSLDRAKKEKSSLLAQTVYLGTLGFMFILPVIIGAYLGVYLDTKLLGYSFSWTVCLIFVGVFLGIMNVYLFLKR